MTVDAGRGARAANAPGVVDRDVLARALDASLPRDEFRLCYQPIIDVESGRAAGAEALLRWRSPTLGEVPPARFVPIAEELDLGMAIDEWVATSALDQIVRWRMLGIGPAFVAIKITPSSVRSESALGAIAARLGAADLPGDVLMLEIPEGALIDEDADASPLLREVKKSGVRLAVDDFGTGYAALGHLRGVPFDGLRIDAAFVRGLPHQDEDALLVRAIIEMAHRLGLRVIAEGVETPEQLEFLHRHRCDLAQGYLFSRALMASDLANHLSEN